TRKRPTSSASSTFFARPTIAATWPSNTRPRRIRRRPSRRWSSRCENRWGIQPNHRVTEDTETTQRTKPELQKPGGSPVRRGLLAYAFLCAISVSSVTLWFVLSEKHHAHSSRLRPHGTRRGPPRRSARRTARHPAGAAARRPRGRNP